MLLLRALAWSFAAVAVFVPARPPAGVGAPAGPGPAVQLDARRDLYREDAAAARPVAAIAATLWRRGDAIELEVEVAAVGDGVVPLPGVEGAPAANLRTAEELHALLRDGALWLETRPAAAGDGAASARRGELRAVERGHVPVRRLRPDGRVEGRASAAELPLRVRFASGDLPGGTCRTVLVAGGVPRLSVDCERTGASARILAIASLGEPVATAAGERPVNALQTAALVLGLGAAAFAQELPADWADRDVEGKWMHYHRDCAANPKDADRKANWGKLLGARREFELLELLAIHEGWRHFGGALARADAPQTFRVAVWNLGGFDSHNSDTARQTLVSRSPEVLQWLDRHPDAEKGKARALRALLAGAPARGPLAQLPPLDPIQVLVPMLDAPAQLAEFGDRRRAEPKVHYLHQVLRALDGVLVHGEVDAQLVPKVLALVRHREASVRTAAFTTLTGLPGDLVPDQRLLAIADGDDDAAVRRQATVALSFSTHPRAYYALLAIATAAAHPGAEAARSRLVEIADPAAAVLLDELVAPAEPEQQVVLLTLVTAVCAQLGKTEWKNPTRLRSWLERAAWLRCTGDPRADRVGQAIVDGMRARLAAAALAELLPQLEAAPPRSPFAAEDAVAVQQAVSALVRRLR